MASQQDIQDSKELMKGIKHYFIPHLSTQEEDEEKDGVFHSCLEKIEKQLESRKLESSKFDDPLQYHGYN